MNLEAHRNGDSVEIVAPVTCDIRFRIETRDDEEFAALNAGDLESLWNELPNGACRTERGEIECYLCSVAENGE